MNATLSTTANTKVDYYAVIGNPIEHSKSPDIHARFAAQTHQNLQYDRLLAPLDGFLATVQSFVRNGGKGLNVTVPFKLEAYAMATTLTERARAAGAVNTLKFDGAEMLGDNTDGVGLVTDIVRNAGIAIADKSVLLLGAGGAARGVILPLLSQQPLRLVVANRTHSKALDLARRFSGEPRLKVSEFAALEDCYDIVINATAASLASEVPPISSRVFTAHTLAYDMMYGNEPTAFLRFAKQHGAVVRDGLGMLVEQAAESFYQWRNVRPETAGVFEELRERL